MSQAPTFFYKVNRKLYPRLFSKLRGYRVVNEFPKSGGTWVSQMLADALDMPFPQHKRLTLSRAIVHGHFLQPFGLHNVLVVWRDPRDVSVSYYFHCYFKNEHHNRRLVDLMRNRLPFQDYADIRSNLPAFLRFLNETPIFPRFTWAEFARTWAGRQGVVSVKYEDLRAHTAAELRRIAGLLGADDLPDARLAEIVETHSFAQARARAEAKVQETGAEMSFVREGSTGGWRKHFSDEAEALAERYYGAAMAQLGYN